MDAGQSKTVVPIPQNLWWDGVWLFLATAPELYHLRTPAPGLLEIALGRNVVAGRRIVYHLLERGLQEWHRMACFCQWQALCDVTRGSCKRVSCR